MYVVFGPACLKMTPYWWHGGQLRLWIDLRLPNSRLVQILIAFTV
jgi:hypothetical protein